MTDETHRVPSDGPAEPKDFDKLFGDELNVLLQKDRDYPEEPNVALAMIWGSLFPEWEMDDYTPDKELIAWIEQSCGWHL